LSVAPGTIGPEKGAGGRGGATVSLCRTIATKLAAGEGSFCLEGSRWRVRGGAGDDCVTGREIRLLKSASSFASASITPAIATPARTTDQTTDETAKKNQVRALRRSFVDSTSLSNMVRFLQGVCRSVVDLDSCPARKFRERRVDKN
jgi:hypothetical protein